MDVNAPAGPILTPEPVSAAALSALLADREVGAVVTFEGLVRGSEGGRPIQAIHYEAYTPMAAKEIVRILRDAEERWPVRALARHRTGRVAVGEASIALAVAASHRAEAFEACRWIIDQIKAIPPIWKATFEWA